MRCEDAVSFYQTELCWILDNAGVAVAAELAIADRLAPGPLTAMELARETDSNGRALEHVLRAPASKWYSSRARTGVCPDSCSGSSGNRRDGMAKGFRDHGDRERTGEYYRRLFFL